ncbi:Threonine aldolase [Coemansia sp. Benny D115]|nr:Threonine aldolase [Coemansia sp. Benny D115]
MTTPTEGMRAAMFSAPVGDDVYGEDPTVIALESRVAALCGKPAALFCASSTMANQLAIRTHLRSPPESLLCHADSHVFLYESGGAALHSQATAIPVKPLDKSRANLSVEDVRRAFISDRMMGLKAPTGLITLENTFSGALMPLEDIREISVFAHENNVPVHLDGSRLWNAAVAEGRELSEYAEHVDSLNLCLSKGMGCPVGAVLVGSEQFIARARQFRKAFGGGWRQAGILAAAGLYAIDEIWPRMHESHERAKTLAECLVRAGFELALPVDTNMVLVREPRDKPGAQESLVARMSELGVRVESPYDGCLRLVLHHQIDDECVAIFKSAVKTLFE